VPDFVPHGLGHGAPQLAFVARQAFMRPLVDGDPVRHGDGLADAAGGQRPTLVQTQQTRPRRLVLDDDDDVQNVWTNVDLTEEQMAALAG